MPNKPKFKTVITEVWKDYICEIKKLGMLPLTLLLIY